MGDESKLPEALATKPVDKTDAVKDMKIAQLEKRVAELEKNIKSINNDVALALDNGPGGEDAAAIIDWAKIVLHKYYSGEKP